MVCAWGLLKGQRNDVLDWSIARTNSDMCNCIDLDISAESARLVHPWHLRRRTVQLTCGTVQLFFDFLLHLISIFVENIYRFFYGDHFYFPMAPIFEPTKTMLISGQSTYYY